MRSKNPTPIHIRFSPTRIRLFSAASPVLRACSRSLCAVLILAAATASAVDGKWSTDTDGLWSDTSKWAGGTVADGTDGLADFATVNITALRTVTLDSARTIGTVKFGDATTANNNWVLGGSSVLTLGVGSGNPTVNASNQTATVGLPLSSSQQVLFSGANLAVTNSLNTLSGGAVVQCSQFGFTSQEAIGSGTIQLGNGPGGNVVGPGQLGFNAIGASAVGTAPVTLANNFEVRTVRWITGQSGVGQNAQPIIINGNVNLDMGINNVRDIAIGQPLTINGVLSGGYSGVSVFGVTLAALGGANARLTLANPGNNFQGNVTLGAAGCTVGINSDEALGYFNNRVVFTTASTLRADASFTIPNSRGLSGIGITLTANGTFDVQANDLQVDTIINGGAGLIKSGTGKLTLTGANTFAGVLTLNAGTLAVASSGSLASSAAVTIPTNCVFSLADSASVPNLASYTINNGGQFTMSGSLTIKATAPITVNAGGLLNVSGLSSTFTLNSGQTLSGAGVVAGNVTAASGASIVPGAVGTAGTLTFNDNLNLTGQSLLFDLRNSTTEGSGINDEIVVASNLVLGGGEKIFLNYLDGQLAAGTYKLIAYGVSKTGNFTLGAAYPNVTLDETSTPGSVLLIVSAPSVANNLFWKGDGGANVWNINTTANWVTNFANPALNYTDPSKVTFDDNGSNLPAVNLTATVLPNSVTFNTTNKSYTIAGTGRISGPTGLIKTGANTVILDNSAPNDFSGPMTIAGRLQIGNNDTSGSIGTGDVTGSSAATATLAYNRTDAMTLDKKISTSLIQVNSGTLTLAGTLNNNSDVLTVNGGRVILGKTSASSVNSIGAGPTTVNVGGTVQLGGTGGDQISSTGVVNQNGGTFDTAGLTEQFSTLTGYGSVIGGGTLSLGGYLGLNSGGTLGVTNTTVTITTASAQWLREPGSVVFSGGTLNLPAVSFAGVGSAGNQNILLDGTLTTAGNGETIFGENTESSVVTFGPNLNASVWFWSYRDTFATTFLYNGGNMALNRFNYRGSSAGAAISKHYFNGTTFTAKGSVNPGFINAGTGNNVKFYVSTNGLIINDAGFNLGVAPILAHDPALGVALDGGLTKSGSGSLSLLATNTFNGSVTVNAGTLILNNVGTYNTVLFGDNTTNQINVVQSGVSLTNNSLTLGTTGGGTQALNFNLGTLGNPTQPVLQVNNVVTNSGNVVVSVIAPYLVPGTAPLIHYGSMNAANFASTWTIAPFPYVSLTLTNDTVNKLISVIVVPGVTPKWKGNINTAWDTTTQNWTSNGVPANYVETAPPGQPVVFDDTATLFTVDISTATVNPAFISMSNSTAYTVTGTLGIGGTGALIKNGSGSLTLNNASGANTYSGITTVSGGSLVAGQPNALSVNSTMTLNNSALNIGANNQALGSLTLNNSSLLGSGTLSGGSLTINNSSSQILPPLAGNVNLTLGGTGTIDMINANTPGNIDINAGTLRINNVGALGAGGFTTTTQTRIASGGALVFDGASGTTPEYIHVAGAGPAGGGALVFTNGSVIINGGAILAMDADTTINVGANASVTNSIAFSGGTFNLTKIGGGLLYFNAAPNVIANAGTSIGAGAISGTVTVNSGATFGGAGTITQSIKVNAGAVLAPGNLGIGTLTVNESLTNSGSIVMEISYNGVATNADRVNVATNLVLGGTLTVTDVGPNALTAGDTFKLFNAPSYSGVAFSSVNLPVLASGLGWTNKLAIDGTIAVISTAVISPTLNYGFSGNVLNFSWTGAYKLQWVTNGLAVAPATNAWMDYPGGGSSPVSVTNNLTIPTAFFRLAP